jgi:5'-3' exonuclease
MIQENPTILLDYDGYVCKSFYANKEDMMNFKKAEEILSDLSFAALNKASKYFKCSSCKIDVIKIMSGHSWKKDIYPSYKRSRKRDEFLGLYRDIISKRKSVLKIEPLEADEVLIMIADYLRAINNNKVIIFSDDKDLRYYTERYCKINITEQIVEQDPQMLVYNQLNQMLIGDKEDNITGIPKVGEKTAPKILEQYGYTLDGVIQVFKDRNIDIDQTLRDLLLVVPLSDSYLQETEPAYRLANAIITGQAISQNDIVDSMISLVKFLNAKVKNIYDKEEK